MPRPLGTASPHGDVGDDSRPAAAAFASLLGPGRCLDRAGSRYPGRPLGRAALFRTRLGLDRQSQSEHVHSDRHRHRRCLPLQRGRHPLPTDLSGHVSRPRREVPVYFEAAPSSPPSCSWARCSSSAPGARRRAQSRRSSASPRRPHGGSCDDGREEDVAARPGAGRRSAPHPPGRKGAGRRRRRRGHEFGR